MSASLVGSEMCIRDSSRVVFVEPATYAGNRARFGAWPGRSEMGGAERAVSYTHLTLPTICSV
eukprot:3112574-Alexandrium_andersonii.AAC.1